MGVVELGGQDRDTVKRAQFLMTGPRTRPHPHFPHFHASAHARKHTATCLCPAAGQGISLPLRESSN